MMSFSLVAGNDTEISPCIVYLIVYASLMHNVVVYCPMK